MKQFFLVSFCDSLKHSRVIICSDEMTVQQKQCRRDSELKRQMMKLIACSAVIIICTWVALKTWIVVGCLLILWMWYMDMRRQGKGSTTVTILIIMTSLVKLSTFLLPFGFPNFPANPYHSQMAKPPHPLFRNTVSHLNSHVFRFQTGWSKSRVESVKSTWSNVSIQKLYFL